MTYTSRIRPIGVSPFVSIFSPEGWPYNQLPETVGLNPVSSTYPATNRAYYYPVVISSACTIYRYFWLNGATASTNNIQVGLYNDNDSGTDGPGTSILLGTSTTASGANACQFDNVTDTALGPGRYWLAIWGSGTTTTLFRLAPTASTHRFANGYLESSLTGGLPSTATPAQNTTPYIPVFGFTTISAP